MFKTAQNFIYLMAMAICMSSCDNDDSPIQPMINGEHQDLDEVQGSGFAVTSIQLQIITPNRDRDTSIFDNGYRGIFENPSMQKVFIGQLEIDYDSSAGLIDPAEVMVSWSSNIDGPLYQGHPDDDLFSDITADLSKGIHTIYFEASIDSVQAIDSIFVSNIVALEASPNGHSVKLKWSKYNGNGFLSYDLYREPNTLIASFEDINTLYYEDKTIESLIDDYSYQVVINTKEDMVHVPGSNLDRAHAGIYLEFPHYVWKTIKDPFREKTYSIVRPQSSFDESDQYGILVLDLNTDTIQVESHILTDDRFADLDISPDGKYLFLCQERVEKITRVDLETMEVFTFITETNDWGIHKIEVDHNYRLYCHRDPPTSGSTSFWIYDGSSGDYVNGPVSGLRHGDIELNLNNNMLYGGESNTSAGRIHRYQIDGSSVTLELSYPAWPNSVRFPKPFMLFSDDQGLIFWENFQLDLSLNVTRTFGTHMIACSPKNKVLSDENTFYRFDNLEVICILPESPPSENTGIIFINDESALIQRSYNTNIVGQEYTYFFRINGLQ